MIRHFGIYPQGFQKDDLFDEQKIFLMYLLGRVPTLDDWAYTVEYSIRLAAIDKMTIDDVDISQEELDLAEFRGEDIEVIKNNRLEGLKRTKTQELKKEYGIKDETESGNKPKFEIKNKDDQKNAKQLWDLLQGKGLV